MDKASYEYTIGLLISQRKKLMDILESQGDFPDPKLIAAYDDNKYRIIELDAQWARIERESHV
jgi:hypothetical protein